MDNAGPEAHTEVERLLRQQAVLAKFGELALKSSDLDEILTQACVLVGEALGTDLAGVVELQADGQTLRVRSGIGWKSGVVGVAEINLGETSSETEALRSGEPVRSRDIAEEERFEYAPFLKDNGVRAIVNVAILGSEDKQPFGILQVDSRVPREFTDSDILFLRGYANLLAAAVARLRGLEQMLRKEEALRQALVECRHGAERQNLLSREVDHRSKNMLAVLQAALRLTKAKDVPSFVQAFEGRVAALARAQTLLAGTRWKGADLHALLRGELGSYLEAESGPRAELHGQSLMLPSAAVQPFSMALHEMVTNAIKFGALSSPTGRLRISWQAEDDILRLRWTETGGPPVEGPPSQRGFGNRVLTDTLRMQLRGTIYMAWEPAGLVCDFAVPLLSAGPTRGTAA